MNGNSKVAEEIKVLLAGDTVVMLSNLKSQLQLDVVTGLVASTLSATKIAQEHIEKLINDEEIDKNTLSKLFRYYYGVADKHKSGNMVRE